MQQRVCNEDTSKQVTFFLNDVWHTKKHAQKKNAVINEKTTSQTTINQLFFFSRMQATNITDFYCCYVSFFNFLCCLGIYIVISSQRQEKKACGTQEHINTQTNKTVRLGHFCILMQQRVCNEDTSKQVSFFLYDVWHTKKHAQKKKAVINEKTTSQTTINQFLFFLKNASNKHYWFLLLLCIFF